MAGEWELVEGANQAIANAQSSQDSSLVVGWGWSRATNLVSVFSEPLKQLTQRPVEGFCYSASGLNVHPGQPVFHSPSLPLAGQVSQLGQAALGQPQFFPSSADALTELLAQTAVKCSSFHLAAYDDEADQANSNAQGSLFSCGRAGAEDWVVWWWYQTKWLT